MVKAIIFDVGGVLIRTHSWAGREKWAARLGMDARDFENFVFSGESGRQAQLGQYTVWFVGIFHPLLCSDRVD